MPNTNRLPANDPVSQVVARSSLFHGHSPIPLTATDYAVDIIGGLADVTVTRTFCNGEALSLEALLAIPIPVHAVLYDLEAVIGERRLKALARDKAAAREVYEDALFRGKTAVLHEEVLRGIHLLSVGHLAPQTEVKVTVRFAIALCAIGGRCSLRLPTTVGEVYGRSGLPDSDELVHAHSELMASLSIASDTGEVRVGGCSLSQGRTQVRLDAPIDIEILNWAPKAISGTAADGRTAHLHIRPANTATADLDAAVLVDCSGSMGERCSGTLALSKFEAVLLGLSEADGALKETDRLNLWDFDDLSRDLGTTRATPWRTLLQGLRRPTGGTDIGAAVLAVLGSRKVGDILLVTDGKSHALPVQYLARSGVRFSVVLIGEDSLEANVGHLAALTGGQIFVPLGSHQIGAAIREALNSMRLPSAKADGNAGNGLTTTRAGMTVEASWQTSTHEAMQHGHRAVAAYAAALKLATLEDAEATKLAVSEGLVTHLTSLVLVDDDGKTQTGLPVTRKIPLATPRTASADQGVRMYMRDASAYREDEEDHRGRSYCMRLPHPVPPSRSALGGKAVRARSAAAPSRAAAPAPDSPPPASPKDTINLLNLSRRIDWRSEAARLADGNMVGLAPDVADDIDRAASRSRIKKTARKFGLSPRLLVIALLARATAKHDRFADRVFRALLNKLDRDDQQLAAHTARQIGL